MKPGYNYGLKAMVSSTSDIQSTLFNEGQIRLAELSVYNWGSFHGLHSAVIDPGGTLITGDNGSGKSTLIDGLMALLLPAGRATFNVAAAQGDRSDRTLLSYMRGSFGSAHDGGNTRIKSKREGAVVTALRACYRADDGSEKTLAALFWTTQSGFSLADVKRIYMVAKRNLKLKEILDAFGEGNARVLKQWLKTDPAITCCDDNFSDYRELYRKLLYMDNKNAPALLSRALGLKKIDDLTKLIRELVLEPSAIKEDVRKVVLEFDDLVAIHNKLLDAREQRDHLSKLPGLQKAIQEAEEALRLLGEELEGLPVYLAVLRSKYWSGVVEKLETALKDLELEIKNATEREGDVQLQVEKAQTDYLKAGGDRIENLKRELRSVDDRLERIIKEVSRYQKDVRALDLDDALLEKTFLHNRELAGKKLSNMESEKQEAQNYFGSVSAELTNLRAGKEKIETEIAEIKARPGSNIEVRFQRLRDEMAESLGFEPSQLVFMGELMDVREDQRPWQGAIERALGGLRTTLAVPPDRFSMVTQWLNTRHTGLHVRVQVVGETKFETDSGFNPDGFLSKLVWREHPYREWLKKFLSRFDLKCVSSTEELDATPFSTTRQGLIHKEKGRFEKKDQHKIDDRRYWQLGFSNKSRLSLLQHDLSLQEKQIARVYGKMEQATGNLDKVSERENLWKRLKEYRWEDVNAPYWESKRSQMEKDLAALQKDDGDLEQLKKRWEAAKQELEAARSETAKLRERRGGLSVELRNAREQYDSALEASKENLEAAARERLQKRVGIVKDEDLKQFADLMQRYRDEIGNSQSKYREIKHKSETGASACMSSFHKGWNEIAVDWGYDLTSMEEYLNYLEELEEEGLPRLVEQFKERLNKQASQSLAQIWQRLNSERDDILERIDTVNRVLHRTEFRKGSYLKLGTKVEKFPHVQDFNRKLKQVLSDTTSEDHESRFHRLKQVIEILEKASNPATSNTFESQRLLDPRYQMSFYAEELDAVTQDVLDVMESSSGKSGGEKESFAGIIVAASLAYVLTPDTQDRPVYCTVFLDEAFSNVAEGVSRRVLRVFKELHIHVNLITPYKNLNLARESARSLLIAERNPDSHESSLCEVTWEEIDRRLDRERASRMEQEAQRLGVELQQTGRTAMRD